MSSVQSWTTDFSEYRWIDDQRWRTAITSKQGEVTAVIIDLDVHVCAVELGYARRGKVVCKPRLVRQRQAPDDLESRNVDPIAGMVLFGKGVRSAGFGFDAGSKTVMPVPVKFTLPLTSGRRARRRDTGCGTRCIALCRPLKIGKKEEFVLATPN